MRKEKVAIRFCKLLLFCLLCWLFMYTRKYNAKINKFDEIKETNKSF